MEQLTSTEKPIRKVWIVQDVNFESFDYAVTAFHYFSEALTFVKSVLLAEAEENYDTIKKNPCESNNWILQKEVHCNRQIKISHEILMDMPKNNINNKKRGINYD